MLLILFRGAGSAELWLPQLICGVVSGDCLGIKERGRFTLVRVPGSLVIGMRFA